MAQKYVPVALRRLVRERAGERCEYCLIPEEFTLATHWVDHIVAEKHGGRTEEGNLALSCVLCNQHKGSDLTSIDPETGQIAPLFHPRRDAWSDHFRFVGTQVEPLTPTGRVTVRLLQLNHPDRVEERELLQRLGMLPATDSGPLASP
jgi:5-methylcytosine-specific restriction endonuclease McrA